MLDVDSGAQPSNILCDKVAKNDRAHRRFSRPALPHQQDFLLSFSGIHREPWKSILRVGVLWVFLVAVGAFLFTLVDGMKSSDVDKWPDTALGTTNLGWVA